MVVLFYTLRREDGLEMKCSFFSFFIIISFSLTFRHFHGDLDLTSSSGWNLVSEGEHLVHFGAGGELSQAHGAKMTTAKLLVNGEVSLWNVPTIDAFQLHLKEESKWQLREWQTKMSTFLSDKKNILCVVVNIKGN